MNMTMLEETVAEIQALRSFKEQTQAELRDAKAEASRLRLRVKDLEAKQKALEKQPVVLDGQDEDFLFEGNYTIQFRRRGRGGRVLVLARRGGRPLQISTDSDVDGLLRKAVNQASGRSRSSPKK